mgnify:CR=1 FL=1
MIFKIGMPKPGNLLARISSHAADQNEIARNRCPADSPAQARRAGWLKLAGSSRIGAQKKSRTMRPLLVRGVRWGLLAAVRGFLRCLLLVAEADLEDVLERRDVTDVVTALLHQHANGLLQLGIFLGIAKGTLAWVDRAA